MQLKNINIQNSNFQLILPLFSRKRDFPQQRTRSQHTVAALRCNCGPQNTVRFLGL